MRGRSTQQSLESDLDRSLQNARTPDSIHVSDAAAQRYVKGRIETHSRPVKSLAKQWRPQRILVEGAVSGTALVQELRGEIYSIIPVEPVGDKVTRMAVASAKIEAGQVFLPQEADWLPDLEAELFAFPGSRHDDQCDSISQALFDGDRNMPMEITDEFLATIARVRFEEVHSWSDHFRRW